MYLMQEITETIYWGFLTDASVLLLDRTDGSDPKKRKDYWIKVMVPHGLNIEDGV